MEVDQARQGEANVRERVGAGVVDDVARVVVEAEHLRPVDAVEDGDADLGGRQHVAVGLHADLQSVSGAWSQSAVTLAK